MNIWFDAQGWGFAKTGEGNITNYGASYCTVGRHRQAVFSEEVDYRYYLSTPRECKEVLGIRRYDYSMTTNHARLMAMKNKSSRFSTIRLWLGRQACVIYFDRHNSSARIHLIKSVPEDYENL